MARAPTPRRAVREMAPYNPPLAGCSPKVLEALRETASGGFVATYPEYGEALRRLGVHLGVDPDQVTVGAGTDEVISAVLHAYVDPGDEVIIPSPSFSMFKFYAQLVGGVPKLAPYRGPELSFPATEIVDSIGPRTRAICIASPNNPTGGVLARDQAERILEAADGCAVLVDEAYFDFHGETLLNLLPRWPNLFVARTFSKAYGMAGLRLGVLASGHENMAVVRKGQSPYGVNSLAVRCALAAIEDGAYVRNYVREVLRARDLVYGTFEELGIRYWKSCANFVLFELGSRAARVCSALSEKGILIRDQSANIPGAVRVTVGPLTETLRFLAELRRVMDGAN